MYSSRNTFQNKNYKNIRIEMMYIEILSNIKSQISITTSSHRSYFNEGGTWKEKLQSLQLLLKQETEKIFMKFKFTSLKF